MMPLPDPARFVRALIPAAVAVIVVLLGFVGCRSVTADPVSVQRAWPTPQAQERGHGSPYVIEQGEHYTAIYRATNTTDTTPEPEPNHDRRDPE